MLDARPEWDFSEEGSFVAFPCFPLYMHLVCCR